MARKKDGVNKSEEIRQLLKSNPGMKAKEVIAALKEKGIDATEGLVYFIKGKTQGRKSRKQRAQSLATEVAATTGKSDVVATIRKVQELAAELGGLKKLKALLEVLGA
jgi:hypothetical protein